MSCVCESFLGGAIVFIIAFCLICASNTCNKKEEQSKNKKNNTYDPCAPKSWQWDDPMYNPTARRK